MTTVWVALSFAGFFVSVFAAFFFWNRLVILAETNSPAWSNAIIGSILACLLFAVCFAIGVWFSIARLKGDGWILSA